MQGPWTLRTEKLVLLKSHPLCQIKKKVELINNIVNNKNYVIVILIKKKKNIPQVAPARKKMKKTILGDIFKI